MKKRLLFGLLLLVLGGGVVYAVVNNFSLDSSQLSFRSNSKKSSVVDNFNDRYSLKRSIANENSELEEQIVTLTKKTTFLLLGSFNNVNESSEEYYKRHQEYLALRYAPDIPKDDSSFTGYDEDSQEYLDDLVSGFALPNLFNQFNEHEILYTSYGDIRVAVDDDKVISSITLPDVKMKEENSENPFEYQIINTNLVIYYYFKELDGEYKLYYLFGETTDNLSEYFHEIEVQEDTSTMAIMPSYDSSLKEIYNFEKLEAMSEADFTKIYDENSSNIVIINSYYSNSLVASAHGFFIQDGLVVTTWEFLEKSLINAQYFTVRDSAGNSYEVAGIVTANPDTDIVVIKLKDKVPSKVMLGDSDKLLVEDPVITISSSTGVGLMVRSGIVISTNGYVQSAIPLTSSDGGSPLMDGSGNVVGMNTTKAVNTSISLAVGSDVLREIQDKFQEISFEDIEAISFEKLKEKYYYVSYNEEQIKNTIPAKKWNVYKEIGDVENTITMQLVKASYKDDIVSLRYDNKVTDYISSMQLAVSFKEKLVMDGYRETLASDKKCIYENGTYKVIVMDEFNYLIVVMVRL